jgi:isochorismate pyruvate lyase
MTAMGIPKRPDECADLQEIRAEIDRLDRQIVAGLGERARYVTAAAKFKTDASSVKASERLAAMLTRRRAWAEEEGLSADVIEKLFQDLVAYFIQKEMAEWNASR